MGKCLTSPRYSFPSMKQGRIAREYGGNSALGNHLPSVPFVGGSMPSRNVDALEHSGIKLPSDEIRLTILVWQNLTLFAIIESLWSTAPCEEIVSRRQARTGITG